MKGGYGGYKNSSGKCWMKSKYCSSYSDCDHSNYCTINTCNVDIKKCTYELSFAICRIVGKPITLTIHMKASDTETSISLNRIKATIFGFLNATFSAKS